jgi:hypothetical protein
MGQRKHFTLNEVEDPNHVPPFYVEFSCKSLMQDSVLSLKHRKEYLPSLDPKKVDRQFVFDVFKTVRPAVSKVYINRVMDLHMGSRLKLKKTNDLKLNDETLDLLLKYDHMPVSHHPSYLNQHILEQKREEIFTYHRLHQGEEEAC